MGSVNTRPGSPTIAWEPKRAMALTNAISAPESTAGATRGRVIIRAVRQRLEPRTSADSSMAASIEPRAPTASR